MRKYLITLVITCFFGIVRAQSFLNPILSGFYPDPSICKAGDDYYLVTSTFAYFPGLPIFHSNDLVNWDLIGHAMDRPEQLNLDGAGVSRGLFAPAISYHDGTFYIVCTLVDKLGNFVITAKDPKGPWSNPVALPEVNGIDPSLFFDTPERGGKAYIVFNSIPPNNISMHDGHRTIRMFGFDPIKLKVTGEEKLIVNGGVDMSKKPVWIEAPHFFYKDGWYYLICAEGGTGYNHSEVVFRSKTMDGPFVPWEKNPILTQRHLDPSRKDPVTTTGHADFVVDKDGKWWAVFLGCRPYEGDYYNTGRETFMAPVEWTADGWPVINPGNELVQYSYPINASVDPKKEKFNGNYQFNDEFDGDELNKRYIFLRTKREDWYTINSRGKGEIYLRLRPQTVSGTGNPSFIGFRQPHLKGNVTTAVELKTNEENEKAGLIAFQNEYHYYFLARTYANGKLVIQLIKGPGRTNSKEAPQVIATHEIRSRKQGSVQLKIESNNDKYSFYFDEGDKKWTLLAKDIDAKFLSTKDAAGFVGVVYGLYATSEGENSDNTAIFRFFRCINQDTIYD